jgi:HK97 gp10 family phage protein
VTDTVKITGLAELHKALQELPAKIERNVLRGGLRAGANVIREEARNRAPVKSGALRDSIRVSVRAKRGEVTATIKAGGKKAWYAHLVEYGTARHFIKPKNRQSLFFAGLMKEVVDHPGAQRKPFMRPALDTKTQAAVEAAAAYMRARLPRELKKAGK